MKIVITGATGYIGSHVVALALRQGCRVDALVRAKSQRERIPAGARLTTLPATAAQLADYLAATKPDVVLHLAARASLVTHLVDIDDFVHSNILFGARLLAAMDEAGCRCFAHASTFAEYDTSGRYAPNSFYAATKHALEGMVDYYVRKRYFRAVSLIIYDVYGPRDWRNKFLTDLVRHAISGKRMPATPGEQRAEFVHVEDVAKGFLVAARHVTAGDFDAAHRRFRLDSDKRMSLREVAALLSHHLGRPIDVAWGERPYPPSLISEPLAVGPRLPGWQPEVSLEQGLAELVSEAESLASGEAPQ